MQDSIHIKGLTELQKMLDTLPAKIEANIMRQALMAGLKPIAKHARRSIHSMSRYLAKSFRRSSRRRGGVVTAKLSVGNGFGVKGMPPKNLPLWVEYGTRPHLISVRDKPSRMTRKGRKDFSIGTINKMVARGSLVIGGNLVGPMVQHPGARPHPFLRPALDLQAGAAVVAVAEYVKKRLSTKEGINAAHVEIELIEDAE